MNEAMEIATDKVESWGTKLVEMLPNLGVAMLILLLAWLTGRLLRGVVERAARHASARPSLTRLLGSLTLILALGVGLFAALGVLRLDKTVTSLLAGAGVLGLVLGFAFQDIAANFVSGTMISLRKTFTEGDLIETNDHFGVVEEITLRVTRLRRPQGQLVLIPNKEIFESPLINFTEKQEQRVDLEVGVSYADDLEKAKHVALEAVSGVEPRDTGREPELFYTEFGGSSINFVVRFWIPFKRRADFLGARSDAILAIKQAFDENDLTIPFPIRTLDFGIQGGERLTETLTLAAKEVRSSEGEMIS